MLKLVWRANALEQLDAIAEFIGENNPAAADRLVGMFEQTAEQLTQFPFMHRVGRAYGIREAVVHPNYILIYRVGADMIEIIAVLHTRQQYP